MKNIISNDQGSGVTKTKSVFAPRDGAGVRQLTAGEIELVSGGSAVRVKRTPGAPQG